MEKEGMQNLTTNQVPSLIPAVEVGSVENINQALQLTNWWPEDQTIAATANVPFLQSSYNLSGFAQNSLYSTWDERFPGLYTPEALPTPASTQSYVAPAMSPRSYSTCSESTHGFSNGTLSPPTYPSPPPYPYSGYSNMGSSMYSTSSSLDAESPISSPESLDFFDPMPGMSPAVPPCLPPPLTTKFSAPSGNNYRMFSNPPQPTTERRRVARMPIRKGTIQLWQFLYSLLSDKQHSNIIEWSSNRGANEFRMLEPESIAVWWGTIKSKPTMTYDKFSRSLRYYYHKGILKKIQGERYMYRFLVDPEDMYRHIGSEKRPDFKTMPKEAKMAMGIFQKQSAEKAVDRAPIVTKPPEGLQQMNKVKQEFPTPETASKSITLGLDFNNSNNICAAEASFTKDITLFPLSQSKPILIPTAAW